ncbi:MAG TPA: hypothetical protein VH083_23520 [Myxococcales bacterium]|nr:hypothetical protein [Myxococcales bacterium]
MKDLPPELAQALTPGAEDGQRMQAWGLRVDAVLRRRFTRVHESAHAVMLTVLRGFERNYLSVDAADPQASVKQAAQVEPSDNHDFVDLAGICGEQRLVRPEQGYSHHHLQGVRHDIQVVLARLKISERDAVAWATKCWPFVMEAVDYFWSAIEAVAAAAPEHGKMLGQDIALIVEANRPTSPTPARLIGRLKPAFVVDANNGTL